MLHTSYKGSRCRLWGFSGYLSYGCDDTLSYHTCTRFLPIPSFTETCIGALLLRSLYHVQKQHMTDIRRLPKMQAFSSHFCSLYHALLSSCDNIHSKKTYF